MPSMILPRLRLRVVPPPGSGLASLSELLTSVKMLLRGKVAVVVSERLLRGVDGTPEYIYGSCDVCVQLCDLEFLVVIRLLRSFKVVVTPRPVKQTNKTTETNRRKKEKKERVIENEVMAPPRRRHFGGSSRVRLDLLRSKVTLRVPFITFACMYISTVFSVTHTQKKMGPRLRAVKPC